MSLPELAAKIRRRLNEFDCQPSPDQLNQLSGYWDLLARWNRRINLTALPLDAFPDASIDVLIVEPIVLVRFMPIGRYEWFDFGSGGGSPAIPVKIMAPEVKLTMIEARAKKSAFLAEALRSLKLADAVVRTMRIEELNESGVARLVTVRGVRLDRSVIQTAHQVLEPGGWLAAFATSDELGLDGFSLDRSVSLSSPRHVLHLFRRSR